MPWMHSLHSTRLISVILYRSLSLEMLLILLISLTLESIGVVAQGGEMVSVSTCTCEGYHQVYECTVGRESATLWTGTAFNCPATNNEIVFPSPNSANASCNEGAINGHIIRADNNTYTSRLSILVSSELNGSHINCSSDGSQGTVLVGSSILTIKAAKYPPPSDVQLVNASHTQLTFRWTPVSSSCPAIHYQLITINCGYCPNTTSNAFVICTGAYNTIGVRCVFSVKSVACNNITSNESRAVIVDLRTPHAPTIVKCIPTYTYETKRLTLISVEFTKVESYNISAGVDGSVSSYSIIYRDTDTNVVCASPSILASSCANEICRHNLLVASSDCSNSHNISISIHGNNRLGEGEVSLPVYVNGLGTTNQLVDVSFDWETSTAICSFLQQHGSREKTCSIEYGVRQDRGCEAHFHQSSKSRSDKVYVGYPLRDDLRHKSERCFILTASNGTHSVIMEGSMESITGSATEQSFSIGMVPLGAMLGGLTLTIVIITATFILIIIALIRSKKAILRDMAVLREKMNEQPAIYEEIKYVQKPHSPSPTSTIDTGRNTAYMSLAALTCK